MSAGLEIGIVGSVAVVGASVVTLSAVGNIRLPSVSNGGAHWGAWAEEVLDFESKIAECAPYDVQSNPAVIEAYLGVADGDAARD